MQALGHEWTKTAHLGDDDVEREQRFGEYLALRVHVVDDCELVDHYLAATLHLVSGAP